MSADINVVGGIYQEICLRPGWREIYGSAGRAASAIAASGGRVRLHGYASLDAFSTLAARSALEDFELSLSAASMTPAFSYTHGLATPMISGPLQRCADLAIDASNVVRFGMLEGDAVVTAKYAVYDPQNVTAPVHFADNGSTAEHLALVLNRYEARVLAGIEGTALQLAQHLAASTNAAVVVIKLGAQGALVMEQGEAHTIPAFRTPSVWKIGSGDTFVANFAKRWMAGDTGSQAALYASRATAYYCQHRGFASERQMEQYNVVPVHLTERCLDGYRPKVYLAGPFFTLAQLWVIEEARNQLHALGLDVFSPYHDVGHGSAHDIAAKDLAAIDQCDVLFAVADGLDSGTTYEIGYANARRKKVIIYAENVSDGDLKMMVGAGCIVVKDYVSAVYTTLWEAIT